MINKKGFVLTETLVVIVFLVAIFTFVYVSIIPLLGKYDDMTYRGSDIDIVYKLYAIRKMIYKDSNRSTILSGNFKKITKNDFNDKEYFEHLMEYLELSNYLLVYADSVNGRLSNFNSLSDDRHKEMYNYIRNYTSFNGRVIVLLDENLHTIAHLSI